MWRKPSMKPYLLADGYAAYGKAVSFVVRLSFTRLPQPGSGREFVQEAVCGPAFFFRLALTITEREIITIMIKHISANNCKKLLRSEEK